MTKTNFDRYLAEQLRDPVFAERFQQAGEAWGVALQIAALRAQAGLTQKELAHRLKTSQQQISRLESPGYEGHSLGMLRRVAKVLSARVRVVLERSVKQLRGRRRQRESSGTRGGGKRSAAEQLGALRPLCSLAWMLAARTGIP